MIENPCANCPQSPQIGKCVGCDNKKEISQDELTLQIKTALRMLYEQDYDLLKRQVDERSISHRFALYYENIFRDFFPDYHFDVEYQKNGELPKYYSSNRYARPDFIIHRRNCNKHNLALIEFKPYWVDESNYSNDIMKLQALTSSEPQPCRDGRYRCYNYLLGIHIVLNPYEHPCTISFFKNGEVEPFFTDTYKYQREGLV